MGGSVKVNFKSKGKLIWHCRSCVGASLRRTITFFGVDLIIAGKSHLRSDNTKEIVKNKNTVYMVLGGTFTK